MWNTIWEWKYVILIVGILLVAAIVAILDDRHYRRYAKWRILEILKDGDRFAEQFSEIDPKISRWDAATWRYLDRLRNENMVYYEPILVANPFDLSLDALRTQWRITEVGRTALKGRTELNAVTT